MPPILSYPQLFLPTLLQHQSKIFIPPNFSIFENSHPPIRKFHCLCNKNVLGRMFPKPYDKYGNWNSQIISTIWVFLYFSILWEFKGKLMHFPCSLLSHRRVHYNMYIMLVTQLHGILASKKLVFKNYIIGNKKW